MPDGYMEENILIRVERLRGEVGKALLAKRIKAISKGFGSCTQYGGYTAGPAPGAVMSQSVGGARTAPGLPD